MSEDCLFCKIAAGDVPAEILFQDDDYVAFRDISPAAPTHALVIPRKHIASLDRASDGDERLLGGALLVARDIARTEGIAESGYRTVINTNRQAHQTVFHVHLHVLGGRGMKWPPG